MSEALRKRIAELEAENINLGNQCLLLARLSADEPQFYNPLVAVKAVAIRDEWIGKNPTPPKPAEGKKCPDSGLVDALAEFAQKVIKDMCWGYSELDGCDIQDLAAKLKLIEPHTATIDDIDDERSDFEVGDRICKFTAALAEYGGKG